MTSNVYQPGRLSWGTSAFRTVAGPVFKVAVRLFSAPRTDTVVLFARWRWISRSSPFRDPTIAGSTRHPTVSSYSPCLTWKCAATGGATRSPTTVTQATKVAIKPIRSRFMEVLSRPMPPPVFVLWHKCEAISIPVRNKSEGAPSCRRPLHGWGFYGEPGSTTEDLHEPT